MYMMGESSIIIVATATFRCRTDMANRTVSKYASITSRMYGLNILRPTSLQMSRLKNSPGKRAARNSV